ncbi:MAG: PHP domain-containing protein [Clostridia bacterium]|nr:PHP domain-containing protein [Clostridia bacterium]
MKPACALRADLHLHSTASDGVHPPARVVREAASRGMSLIALTDHDSVDGVPEAASAAVREGVALIPGVELSCEGEREVHLLGYGLDIDCPAWRGFLRELQRARRDRAQRMIRLLREQGCPLDEGEVLGRAAHSMSRTHIARALVDGGMVSGVKEAFRRYLGSGCPAYVSRVRLPVDEAIGRLREAGGIPVLAHPGLLRMGREEVERSVRRWRGQGLMGVEAHYPEHTPAQAAAFDRLARELGMLVTGGSDAHGAKVRPTRIGEGLEGWAHRERDARALWRASAHKVGEL